jgi:hypothetical protein
LGDSRNAVSHLNKETAMIIINKKYIEFTGELLEQECSSGFIPCHDHSSKFRIPNPFYVEPIPNTFDKCIVGQSVIRRKNSEFEYLVLAKCASTIRIAEDDRVQDIGMKRFNEDFEIVRGGKE